MKPFYQGKIDTFCAMYAVLNAFRITHSIRTLKAREIFNDILMILAKDPKALEAVLNQTTDYINLVDYMLRHIARNLPIAIEQPFNDSSQVSVLDFWNTCQNWINAEKQRTAIFRFSRYFDKKPGVRHWTTIGSIDDETLRLYDSSHDAESIQHLHKDSFVTKVEEVSDTKTILVHPETVRLLRLPF